MKNMAEIIIGEFTVSSTAKVGLLSIPLDTSFG